MRIVIAVALALVLLVACVPATTPEAPVAVAGGVSNPPDEGKVLRWCDSQASVVCWKWGYGIDCMPLKDTTLLECK